MNYLAHAYLSFGDTGLLLGNMIADSVRGKEIESFAENIKRGIRLHRQIDEYTDRHPVTTELKNVFESSAGRYSRSFLDISFDYFLATDATNEPTEGWQGFADSCYICINEHRHELPADFLRLFSYMRKENWLYNYRYKWLIEKSFVRLARRAKYLRNNAKVFIDFEANLELLKAGYDEFFPLLKEHTISYISNL
jgi:acyl carrier protein phosphodiesterase